MPRSRKSKSGQNRQNKGLNSGSKTSRRGRKSRRAMNGVSGQVDMRAPGPRGIVQNAEFPVASTGTNFGGRWIERDELVAVIPGSVAFATTQFVINPGLPGTFPGLSKDAQLYSEWRLGSSRFYVKPLVSGYSTQGQTGETILSFDPNVQNPAPASQQQAEFLRHAQAAPYLEFGLDLPVQEINRADSKYIRTSAVPANSDAKTYDGGNLYISTYGQGGTATCCELRHRSRFWVLAPTLLNPSTSVGTLQASIGNTAAAPFGLVANQNHEGAFSMTASNQVVSLNNLIIGDEISITAIITGTVISGFALTTPVGMTLGSTVFAGFPAAATSASATSTYYATATSASITVAVTATTVTSADLFVADIGAKPGAIV